MKVYYPAISEENVGVFEVQGIILKGINKDKVIVSGYVDDIVVEQVYLAYSVIYSKYGDLLGEDKYLHVHFCDYSVFKEGSSCSIAVYILLLGLFGKIKGSSKDIKISSTGELDLYGNIHGVGGLNKKFIKSLDSQMDVFLSTEKFEESNSYKVVDVNELIGILREVFK